MSTITIDRYCQIDVEFLVLNELANRLRAAGARIIVRKLGNSHRIILLDEPKIASVEEILSYTYPGDKTQTIGID